MLGRSSGTEGGTPVGTSEDYYDEPPCREAARCRVKCPSCRRLVQIKTLRYSHVCKRSFDLMERAMEQKNNAEVALRARLAAAQNKERAVDAFMEYKRDKYSHLLTF
jgi:hypothetical protein